MQAKSKECQKGVQGKGCGFGYTCSCDKPAPGCSGTCERDEKQWMYVGAAVFAAVLIIGVLAYGGTRAYKKRKKSKK